MRDEPNGPETVRETSSSGGTGCLVLTVLMLVLAAIAIPSLLKSTVSRGEARSMGDIRSVISAQQTFASANCGYFAGDLRCLTREGDGEICIPDYPSQAPEFLGGDLGRATPYTLGGSVRNFAGVGIPTEVESRCAPQSVLDYCYTTTPGLVFRKMNVFGPVLIISLGPGEPSYAGVGSGLMFVDRTGREIPCPVPSGTQILE